MVHTLVLGENLLQTLHRNLLTRESATDFFGANRWGRPVWEFPVTRGENKPEVENATLSYLGRLVPLSRAIRLNDDGSSIVLASGLDYPIFPAFREASATVIKRKEELGLLPASTSRSLWRQLAAVSVKRRANAEATCGPLALNHLVDAKEIILWIGALVTDKGKIEDVVEASYSLPAGMLAESGRTAYEMGVAHAEKQESSLIQAVKTYASTLKVVPPAYNRARQHFWTRAEQHLSALFDLARNTSLAANIQNCPWGKAVQAAAFDAYSQCCPRQGPRQIEAYALGFRKLTSHPSKPSTPIAHE
jgi:CRISPR system Cascade subunit CasA